MEKAFSDSIEAIRENNGKREIQSAASVRRPTAYQKYCAKYFDEKAPPRRPQAIRRQSSEQKFLQKKFKSDENLRKSYEQLKAFGVKEQIYEELEKSVRRINSTKAKKDDAKRVSSLLILLNKLNDAILSSTTKSSDAEIEIIKHKLQSVSMDHSNCHESDRSSLALPNDSARFYLDDVLQRYGISSKKKSMKSRSKTESKKVVNDFIENFLWPEISQQIDQRANRTHLKVDLNRLTLEEKDRMIENVATECVDSILETQIE